MKRGNIYLSERKSEVISEERYCKKNSSSIFFVEFYQYSLEKGIVKLQKEIQKNGELFSKQIYENFSGDIIKRLQKICLRTLIVQMHEYKKENKLKGKDAKEEYDYFCKNIVGSEEFVVRIFEEYPVLKRCMEEQIKKTIQYYAEVIENFQMDQEKINSTFCTKKKTHRIVRISESGADMHQGGKQVLKIRFDNGLEIFYKPRSMENEIQYEKLLQWLMKSVGIKQYTYPILSYQSHSWCGIVKYAECVSQEQLGNYYRRMGIHLFLAYILGTKDLHYENVIAAGEYPVLVDLEALIHMQNNQERKRVDEEIRYKVSQSVLLTGLLPFYMWNQDGKGVNIGAISGGEGQTYPFKLPMVVAGGTSEMHIEYKHPVSRKSQNQAKMKGSFIEPSLFKNEMLEGFRKAYEKVMERKVEFKTLLDKLNGVRSRIILADTQIYSMLLSASYHPSLLQDGEEREKILHTLWEGRDEKDKNIVECEIRSLLHGDIPYFYVKENDRGIYSGGVRIARDYFVCTVKEIVEQRMARLCKDDMEKQCEYIQISLEMSEKEKAACMNKVYYVKDEKTAQIKAEEEGESIQSLTERLLKNAVWNTKKTEVSWEVIKFSGTNTSTWDIRPMNFYLYDGLAGMLLLFYGLMQKGDRTEIKDIYAALKNQLFSYTEKSLSSIENVHLRYTGSYEGEGSIVFVYLILYRWSNECEYLKQAQNHANVVIKLLEEDDRYDLLSGNAGAAKVLLMLYETLHEKKYLEAAEYAVELLNKSAMQMNIGIGWKIEKELAPMAGMAHGNSGIMLPIATLWKITGKEKYGRMLKEIWLYEEALYDKESNNWLDIRQKKAGKDEIGAVAWCHGVGGILLSRIKCYQQIKDLMDEEWKRKFEKDIERAFDKLEHFWRRDSWCLCHGNGGNLWILDVVGKKLQSEEREVVTLLPQEIANPGVMNGYGGILYWKLKEDSEGMPEIL